jgi:hypothetical protein
MARHSVRTVPARHRSNWVGFRVVGGAHGVTRPTLVAGDPVAVVSCTRAPLSLALGEREDARRITGRLERAWRAHSLVPACWSLVFRLCSARIPLVFRLCSSIRSCAPPFASAPRSARPRGDNRAAFPRLARQPFVCCRTRTNTRLQDAPHGSCYLCLILSFGPQNDRSEPCGWSALWGALKAPFVSGAAVRLWFPGFVDVSA